MFKRILIANRGEIACRIIKTARRMGIETVAVYSDADKDALHVEMADTAVNIGPPAAAESYLVIDKIVAACKATGAEAVHPGYGFLSEREAFPTALAKAGIDGASGAVVVTSRVSVEMVQKTAAIRAPVIVAVSAPTALAIRTAEAAGMTLAALVRGDEFDIFTRADRIVSGASRHVA